MRIGKLLEGLDVSSVQGSLNTEVRAMAYDSRRIQSGALFAALPGRQTDGARFIEDAVARGAAAVVSEGAARTRRNVTHVRVPDARRALAGIACAFHGHPARDLSVAGVTGTNGKTTVCYLLRDMLQAGGRRSGMIGTVVYEIGARVIPAPRTTPEAPDLQDMLRQMVRAGCVGAVMEVSSHALSQHRVSGTEFDVAVFTNLTHDHLDYHGSMEDYFRAKSGLFTALGQGKKSGAAVINIDDPWGRRLHETGHGGGRTLTYGQDTVADVRAADVQMGSEGSRFLLHTPEGVQPVQIPILGRFNISNVLAATAAALVLGIPLAICADVLRGFHAAPGRLEPVAFRKGIRVFVDYAHTDDALRNVLSVMREVATGRLIVVFGCGGNRDRAKRARMGAAAAELADYTFLTNDNPRDEDPETILDEIVQGFGTSRAFERIPSREAAIGAALDWARPGDVVLIAGKGHETYQEFQRTVVPFDDRDVVRRHAHAARGDASRPAGK